MLVSPRMRDERRTWEQLLQVRRILGAHGGVVLSVGLRAGLAEDAAGDGGGAGPGPAAGREVSARRRSVSILFRYHLDVLYRLASDPVAVWRHDPWQEGPRFGEGYVQFPLWSGDLAALREKILIWLAMAAPPRPADESSVRQWSAAEPIGAHAATVRKVVHPSGPGEGEAGVFEPGPAAGTAAARRLFGAIFSAPEDQKRAAALFHIMPWWGALKSRSVPGLPAVAVLLDGGADFTEPGGAILPWQAAAAGAAQAVFAEPTFTAKARAWPATGSPVVHVADGTRSVAKPSQFAKLLAELGWRPGMAVSLLLEHEPGTHQNWAGSIRWALELSGELDAPVILPASGDGLRRVASEPDGILRHPRVRLFGRPGQAPEVPWWQDPPQHIWILADPRPDAVAPPASLTQLPRLPDAQPDAIRYPAQTSAAPAGGGPGGAIAEPAPAASPPQAEMIEDLVVPEGVPGLEPLQRLERIFVIRAGDGGGVVLPREGGSAGAATATVARVRAALGSGDEFVIVLSIRPPMGPR